MHVLNTTLPCAPANRWPSWQLDTTHKWPTGLHDLPNKRLHQGCMAETCAAQNRTGWPPAGGLSAITGDRLISQSSRILQHHVSWVNQRCMMTERE